ncbi:MAG TPA: tetratricopeptide repeat protein [Terriglobales bacterium]|jgi:tetratricopeptide (TPR) repeat protein|nr:tetratricopeptide repeat protein [Terriglobales bacterium]
MTRLTSLLLLFSFGGWAVAQQQPTPGPNQEPPRSERNSERNKEAGESSSRDSRIDLSPPKDDAKNHPYSGAAVSDAAAEASPDVQEFHPWDPHKALKDIEVGDFYLKRKNYRAALDRYQEALVWKPNDAIANFRMAQCFEKLDQPEEARAHYQAYLKILPHGPLSAEAQKGLEKLNGPSEKNQASGKVAPKQ